MYAMPHEHEITESLNKTFANNNEYRNLDRHFLQSPIVLYINPRTFSKSRGHSSRCNKAIYCTAKER